MSTALACVMGEELVLSGQNVTDLAGRDLGQKRAFRLTLMVPLLKRIFDDTLRWRIM